MSRVPRLFPGTTFAKDYRVVDALGFGSMGAVYEVERLSDGAHLALKIIDMKGADDPRTMRRFEREVQAGREIQSEHVARGLAAGREEGRGVAWVAMELAQGPMLDAYVAEHAPLAGDVAKDLMEQLFDAVTAAHRAGMVHRDLKPENIRVGERDGRPFLKVLDFGIAKSFTGLELSGTTPGLGTPLWTAPEQASDDYAPAPSADVWALGLLSFFIVTGKIYWKHAASREGVLELAIEILKSPIAPAGTRAKELGVAESLPPAYEAWFARSVNRDAAARWPDAAAAHAAWQAIFRAETVERSQSPSIDRGRPVTRPGLLLLSLVAGCFGMGYAIYALIQSAKH